MEIDPKADARKLMRMAAGSRHASRRERMLRDLQVHPNDIRHPGTEGNVDPAVAGNHREDFGTPAEAAPATARIGTLSSR